MEGISRTTQPTTIKFVGATKPIRHFHMGFKDFSDEGSFHLSYPITIMYILQKSYD